MEILNEAIMKNLFYYNEKQIILNHITKGNEDLKRNLDVEMEKHKILSEYKSKNRDLQDTFKHQLIQSSNELIRTHKKIIDEQLAIYNEYNNTSRYNSSECKVCMQQEISLVLECGHLLCLHCNEHLLTETKQKINENENLNDNEELIQIDGYPCPFCKIFSSKFIRIYL